MSIFFVLEAERTTFSRPFPTFVVLRWEHLLINRMRTCRKTQVFAKSWNRLGWDFYFCVFRCKHHFLNSFRSVVVNFCENRFLSEGWLNEDFNLLLEVLFSSSYCFVHQTFSCYRLYTTTVFDVDLNNKGFFGCFSSLQRTFCCFETGCWIAELLYNKHYYSLET